MYQKILAKIGFGKNLILFLIHSSNQKHKIQKQIYSYEDKAFPYPEIQPFKKEWATKSLKILGIEADYRFKEDFRLEDNLILIANHRSAVDILLLENLVQQLHQKNSTFIAKKELENAFIMGGLYKLFGVIFIDRQIPRDFVRLSRQADRILEKYPNNNIFVIFPEGTRSKDKTPKTIGEFKKGFLKIAQDKKLNVLPVYIEGYPEEYCEDVKYKKEQIKVNVGEIIQSEGHTMETIEKEYKKQFQLK